MDDSARAGFFSRLFKAKGEETVEDEIVSMLSEGQTDGTILESEVEMITNIFELDDKEASEIMTHRKAISAIDGKWTLAEAMKYICDEGFSRFPVYRDNIDNITGVLHIKDAMRCYIEGTDPETPICDIPDILQKAYFIPETSKIDNIFRNMQSQKIHMQIVVDEYGQTAGIIAMEDILEEIVGNIFDEHDEVEYNIVKLEEGVYQIKGLTALSEIQEETGVSYDDEENDTLNGFLISHLDRIPDDDVGTVVEINNVRYRILNVADKTISEVRMELLSGADEQH